jgi:hypothetical protein
MKHHCGTALVAVAACLLAMPGGASAGANSESQSTAARPRTTFPHPALEDRIAKEGVIEDVAVDALRKMSSYLMTAQTLQVNTVGSLDVVTNDGQRIQLDGTTTYKIRRPGFVIDYESDMKSRKFIYDGKTFTVYSPKLGYYATVPAPATNREVLSQIYQKFGISLPLEDLFRWADPSSASRVQQFQSAYDVGPATIDGVETEHYAFREPDVDWEVWIQQGDQPLPRKLVIVNRNDPAKPTFTTRLAWTVNPTFSDADFAFVPDANAKQIQLATYKGPGE